MLACLGRCVTHARPLLTPSVAQQGLFVWYRRATRAEGGGGWCRGMAAAALSAVVCLYVWLLYVSAELAGGLMHDVMCLCACMFAPGQCVESVVVYKLTVTDKHTLTTGVKKLNALYALFSPRRLTLTFSPPIFIFYIFLSVILSCFFSLPDDFFLLLPPPCISDDFSRGVTHWASSHNVR